MLRALLAKFHEGRPPPDAPEAPEESELVDMGPNKILRYNTHRTAPRNT